MPAKKSAKKTAKKAAAPKVAAKKTSTVSTKAKKNPTTGQSGAPLDLVKAKLNDKEAKVVAILDGDANPVALNAIAAGAGFPAAKANSWARNSLRRLVRAKWVAKVGRGTYRLTQLGHDRYNGQEPKVSLTPSVTTTVEHTA